MTLLFARVRSPAEAEAVVHAGFDGVAGDGPPRGAGLWRESPDSDGTTLTLAGPEGQRRAVQAFVDLLPDAPTFARTAADGTGLLLGATGRLVDHWGMGALAAIRARCREAGLWCGFAGGLEAPDLPRLLALQPDALVVGRALRRGGAGEGALDPEALRLVRDLVPREAGERGPAPAAPGSAAPSGGRADRVFVRDLVLPVAIGAYGEERGRLQRVRFAVDADLHRLDGPARDMRDVVSYDLFTDAIERLTRDRHLDVVETLAEEIAAEVLTHPRVLVVRVTVEKLDVGPGSVGISIERGRRAS